MDEPRLMVFTAPLVGDMDVEEQVDAMRIQVKKKIAAVAVDLVDDWRMHIDLEVKVLKAETDVLSALASGRTVEGNLILERLQPA